MAKPRAWLCWSSGKDSAWALHTVRQRGEVEVVGLLATVTEPYQRVSMHGVREKLGEFHTCVTAGPMFRRPIPVTVGETVERDGFVFTDLTPGDSSSPLKKAEGAIASFNNFERNAVSNVHETLFQQAAGPCQPS